MKCGRRPLPEVYGVTRPWPWRPIPSAAMGNGPAATISTGADLDGESRFVRAPDVLWRQSADVVLIRTLSDPTVIELGGTGVLLWLALVEPVTARELAAELAEVLGAPADVVTADVHRALADLVHRGFVTRFEEAS